MEKKVVKGYIESREDLFLCGNSSSLFRPVGGI